MVNQYKVWCPERGEDGAGVRAANPEEAAEKWSSAEYAIVAGRSMPVVRVYCMTTGAVTAWEVRGKCLPTYYAREKPVPDS